MLLSSQDVYILYEYSSNIQYNQITFNEEGNVQLK